jgi:hypothetical protein
MFIWKIIRIYSTSNKHSKYRQDSVCYLVYGGIIPVRHSRYNITSDKENKQIINIMNLI